jgi:neutral ceramidase
MAIAIINVVRWRVSRWWLIALAIPSLAWAQAGLPPVFMAGAARVEITPAADEALRMAGYASRVEGHQGIHDPLYVRAVAVDDGASRGLIAAADLIGMPNDLWERTSARVARETGVPVENMLLAGTHTHGAPTLSVPQEDRTQGRQAAYIRRVEDAFVEAARQAITALVPARVGAGTGRSNVNMNRRARMANGGWWLGANPDGVSNKTTHVVKFETAEGAPIAILVNHGVHGTALGTGNMQITGDVPGATSRFIEDHFGGRVVAPWTSGAAGDQDPLYRVHPTNFEGAETLGRIMAEEALRVAGEIRTTANVRVRGAQTVITCPGRRPAGPSGRRADLTYAFEDADPQPIRLSVLLVGPVAFTGVSGEVLTRIGERLAKASPYTHTLMLTHTNGSSGYLPDDAAYEQISYEIVVTRVKPGCAEDGIVNGLLELMEGL